MGNTQKEKKEGPFMFLTSFLPRKKHQNMYPKKSDLFRGVVMLLKNGGAQFAKIFLGPFYMEM